MVFNTGAALLDAIVLAVVSREQEGTYGYKITQDVRRVLDVSESTMYPVLRRLQKDSIRIQPILIRDIHMREIRDMVRVRRQKCHGRNPVPARSF